MYVGRGAFLFVVAFGSFMIIIFLLDYLPVSSPQSISGQNQTTDAYSKIGGDLCKEWDCYVVGVVVTVIVFSNIAAILYSAGKIAPRLFTAEFYDSDQIKPAIVGNLQTLSVVLALFLTLLFAMATSTGPLNALPNAIFPQLYYCFVFNGIGISFYGLSCTIIPLIFLQILNNNDTQQYLKQEPFLNGLGAIMTCIVVICVNLGFALIVFSLATFGKPMGFACSANITVLFIGIYNKLKRHATWEIPSQIQQVCNQDEAVAVKLNSEALTQQDCHIRTPQPFPKNQVSCAV